MAIELKQALFFSGRKVKRLWVWGHDVSLQWLGQVKLLLSQIKGQHTFYLSVSPEASALSAPSGLCGKKREKSQGNLRRMDVNLRLTCQSSFPFEIVKHLWGLTSASFALNSPVGSGSKGLGECWVGQAVRKYHYRNNPHYSFFQITHLNFSSSYLWYSGLA